MSAIDRRLGRLEAAYRRPPDGCPACRGWSARVFLRDDEAPRPETCPACGRTVPIRLVRRYLVVAGVPEVAA